MIHRIYKNDDRLIISHFVNNIVAKSIIICERKITDKIDLSLSKNIGKRIPGYR